MTGPATARLRDALALARHTRGIQARAAIGRLRYRPPEHACQWCGHHDPAVLVMDEGVGLTCRDAEWAACSERHADRSDPLNLSCIQPLIDAADAAEWALAQVQAGIEFIALSNDQAGPGLTQPVTGRPYDNNGHMISGDERHRAAMLGTVRDSLALAGHADNRRLMGYGRIHRGASDGQDAEPGQDAPPEEAAARRRSARGKWSTSPFAVPKRAAQARKRASKGSQRG